MSIASFDAWFHGCPLPLVSGQTKQFDYWFHGSPFVMPDVTSAVTTTQGLQMRCRILSGTNQTLDMRTRIQAMTTCTINLRGRIMNSSTYTFSMRGRISILSTQNLQMLGRINVPVQIQMLARIQSPSTQSLQMRGRINAARFITARARLSRQQGWPIPNVVDPAFALFQPTQLNIRGRVTQGNLSNQSLNILANIFKGSTWHLMAQARIVKNHQVSMRANIIARTSGSILRMIYSVNRASQAIATMLFYTQGNLGEQAMTMSARIVRSQKTRFTGHFIVFNAPSGLPVVKFDFSSSQRSLQQVGMVANVVRP